MQHWSAAEVLAPTPDGEFRRMVAQHARIRAGLLGYPVGGHVILHAHTDSDEVFFVVEGAATFTVDGVPHEAAAGDLLFVGAGELHEIHVRGDAPLVLLAAVAPNQDDAYAPSQSAGG